MLFAEVGNIRAGSLEDPQAQQAEHGHEGEVVPVGGLAGCGEQGLELKVRESERRRLCGNRRAADMLGG